MTQIFDAAIIVTSFVLDLVFVEGSVGSEGEQAAVIIMIFLLWRILRIVNGRLLYRSLFFNFQNRFSLLHETRSIGFVLEGY
jgi:hypothetical protein